MFINARISKHDPACYTLSSGGTEVGWLRAGVLGFRGFPNLDRAARAAEVAAATLSRWYRVRWQSRDPLPWGEDVPDHLRIMAGQVLVGRIVAPDATPASDGTTFGFVLRTPKDLWVATAVGLAQRIYTALDAHGITAAAAPASVPAQLPQTAPARRRTRAEELISLPARGGEDPPPDSAA